MLRLKEDRLNGEKGLTPKRLAKAASIVESNLISRETRRITRKQRVGEKGCPTGQVTKIGLESGANLPGLTFHCFCHD